MSFSIISIHTGKNFDQSLSGFFFSNSLSLRHQVFDISKQNLASRKFPY